MLTINLCRRVARNSLSLRMESMLRLVMMLRWGRVTWPWTSPSLRRYGQSPGAPPSTPCRIRPYPPCSGTYRPSWSGKEATELPATQPHAASSPSTGFPCRSPASSSRTSAGTSTPWRRFYWERARGVPAAEGLHRRSAGAQWTQTTEIGASGA